MWFFFFFFSSRRRHTRFDCDWSSDVCSSDLKLHAIWSDRPMPEQWAVTPLDVCEKRMARRSEEHTSELQSQSNLVCRLLLEKKKKTLRQITVPGMEAETHRDVYNTLCIVRNI